jgi:RHS repeat-associated protein
VEVRGWKDGSYNALLRVTENEYTPIHRNGTEGAQLDRVVIRTYESGVEASVKTTTYTYDPDGYGNVVTKLEEATDLPPVRTENEFVNDPSRWILGRPITSTISAFEGGRWVRLQRMQLAWEGDHVRRQEEWLDTTGELVIRWMTYDAVGNRIAVTEPRTLGNGQGPATETTYDAAFRQYPIQVTRWIDAQRSKRQVTRAAYDVAGLVVCEADQNHVKRKTAYDVRGRKVRAWVETDGDTTGCSPAQQGTVLSDTEYRYENWGTADQATTTIVKTGAQTLATTEYFDGSGFVYLTRESTSSGQDVCTGHEKRDPDGRTSRESLPYLCAEPASARWFTTTWDPAGRRVRVEAPDGRATTFTYGVDFERSTDPRGVSTTHYFDARRRVRRIVDGLGATTQYDYDAIGRLTRVQLPTGQVTTIAYDSLGRRTSVVAPQIGGSNVAFEYDGFNRRTRSYEWQTGRTLATYTYDETAFANGQGRLTSVTDLSGTTRTSYNALGLPDTVVKEIDGKTYTHAFTYDLAGRPTRVLYPDGSAVEYGYTDRFLTNVSLVYNTSPSWSDCRATPTPSGCARTAIATYSDFTPGGQAQLAEYGNGTKTRYSFDMLGRLLSLRTTDRTGAAIQDLAYDWESMSGITVGSITDRRPDKSFRDPVTGALIPTTDETQVYGYDDAYRLTSATGVWGTKTYAYDAIGNATGFGGVTARTLQYDGQQLTGGTGLADVRYDSAGNMMHRVLDGTSWDYEWTATGQLERVHKMGLPIADMVYDVDGKRTQKVFYPGGDPSRAVTTTYVGNTYEERAFADDGGGLRTEHTLHVLVGDQVLLSVTRVGAQAVAFRELNGWRTELAAASMHDGTTLRGAGAKVLAWSRALAAHPETVRTVVLGAFAVFAVVVLGGLAMTLRRGRDRRSWVLTPSLRSAAAAIVLVFTFTSCGRDPSGQAVGGGRGADALSGDSSLGVGAGWRYYHGNQVNSSSVITDGTGAVSSRIVYLPFGEVSSPHSGGPDSVSRKYTGQEADLEVGLQYYGSRYYDPALGRFISADSIVPSAADAQAFNRYAYARNNPILYMDPTGHNWFTKNWKAIVSVVIVVVLVVAAIVASIYCPPAGAILWKAAIGAAIGAASGAATAAAKGGDWQNGMLVGAVVGGATGAAGGAAGGAIADAGYKVLGGMVSGAIAGAGQGFIAGWAGGAGTPGEIWKSVIIGLVVGAAFGAMEGWATMNGPTWDPSNPQVLASNWGRPSPEFANAMGKFGAPRWVAATLASYPGRAMLTIGTTAFTVDDHRLEWKIAFRVKMEF